MIIQIDYQFLKGTKLGIKLQVLNIQTCEAKNKFSGKNN
jgi:hypothetical protein